MRPRQPSDYRRRELELEDQKPLTTRCLKCGWFWAGPALAARERALQHRQKQHPEIGEYRQPKRKRLSTFRTHKMTEDEVDEVQVERTKRARLTGVELDPSDLIDL